MNRPRLRILHLEVRIVTIAGLTLDWVYQGVLDGRISVEQLHSIHHAGITSMVTSVVTPTQSEFQRILAEWPVSIERKGIILTSFGESVPFVEFMLNGNLVLLDRGVPDTANARRVILAVDMIVGIKITDPIEMARFTSMGFQANMRR